jgi:hypothetical protein
MRFSEFRVPLNEANLAYGEIRKDYGKYVVSLVNKIRAGQDLVVDPASKDKFGETVVIEPQEADTLLKVFFGDSDPQDESQLPTEGERNMIIPPDERAAKNLRLKIKGSDQTIGLGQLYKSSDLKGGKGFNTGDVAEGVLGAAVTAKFIAKGNPITEQDVANIIAGFTSVEEIKSNKKGVMSTKAGIDQITFRLVLNKTSFEAIYEAATKNKYEPEMKGLFKSGVEYANKDRAVQEAVSRVVDDPNSNKVSINSDGVADQKGTKADLFLNIDGEVINLLSLKAGDVKQFGQKSGYTYEAMEEFFETTFGVRINDRYRQDMEGKGARENFTYIQNIYKDIASQLEDELAGNTNQETVFLQRLYNGIFYHATRNDPNVSMVILKARPNAPGFSKLTFGEELRQAMEQFDLKIQYQDNPPKIQVYGVPVGAEAKSLAGDNLLIQVRSNLKGDSSEGYVRNIVEMGGLLKKIASVEKMLDTDPEEPAKPTTGLEKPETKPKPQPANNPNATI